VYGGGGGYHDPQPHLQPSDHEHSSSFAVLQSMGVDLNKLHLNQTSCGEDALEMVDQTVRSSCADLIVIDSVAALTPRAELEGEMGDKLSKRPDPLPVVRSFTNLSEWSGCIASAFQDIFSLGFFRGK